MRPDLDWQFQEGRGRDGDKFSTWLLVHASGRLLARVSAPLYEHEQRLDFFCKLDHGGVTDADDLRFIDIDSAKRFAEKILDQYDPEPRRKAPRFKRQKAIQRRG